MKHSCVRKNREMEREEQPIRWAFLLYQQFYKKNSNKKSITWDDFAKSRYYNDFTKVGRFMESINAVNVLSLIDFYASCELPIKEWPKQNTYAIFLRKLLRNETPSTAIERNIQLMQKWSDDTGHPWNTFFENVSPNRAATWIQTGRISPWLVYLSEKSDAMLNRFNEEHWSMVGEFLDPNFWEARMNTHRHEVERIKTTLRNFGL